MIANDPKLVQLYNEFVEEVGMVYPNAALNELPTAEEFFEMLDFVEAEYDEEEVYDEYLDVSVLELLEMIGFEVEATRDGGFRAIPRTRQHDA